MKTFDLEDFIIESNDIEREATYLERELPIYEWWLANECNEENLKTMHRKLCTARRQLKMKNRGHYRKVPVYIAGRECSAKMLDGRMWDFWNDFWKTDGDPNNLAYENHKYFEEIHPFLDLNGRTGRAIWLHQMGGEAPMGFLHTWYYQSLSD